MNILTKSKDSVVNKTAQLLFDFNSSFSINSSSKRLSKSSVTTLSHKEIKRSVLAWIVGQGVNGVGLNVSTRVKRFKADVAAFWSDPKANLNRRGPSKILKPVQTILILCKESREECWPDFSRSEGLFSELKELKQKRGKIETYIQNTEPHLHQNFALFQEFNDWDYEKTTNSEYHILARKIHAAENAIYKGSKFERMQTAAISNQLVLAVPEDTVDASELAEGWGLLWVQPDRKIKVVVPPKEIDCPAENRFHLVQNIASATMDQVLFHQGIQVKENKYHFSQLPRSKRLSSTTPQIIY